MSCSWWRISTHSGPLPSSNCPTLWFSPSSPLSHPFSPHYTLLQRQHEQSRSSSSRTISTLKIQSKYLYYFVYILQAGVYYPFAGTQSLEPKHEAYTHTDPDSHPALIGTVHWKSFLGLGRPDYGFYKADPIRVNKPPPREYSPCSSEWYLVSFAWFASQRLLAILLLSFASFLHLFMPLTACFYTCEARRLIAWLKGDPANFYTGLFCLWSFYANIF